MLERELREAIAKTAEPEQDLVLAQHTLGSLRIIVYGGELRDAPTLCTALLEVLATTGYTLGAWEMAIYD